MMFLDSAGEIRQATRDGVWECVHPHRLVLWDFAGHRMRIVCNMDGGLQAGSTHTVSAMVGRNADSRVNTHQPYRWWDAHGESLVK